LVIIKPLPTPAPIPRISKRAHAQQNHARSPIAECGISRVHDDDHDAGDDRGHGADRQVEPAGGDDEGRADRDDADEGRTGQDVGDVVVVEEILGLSEIAEDAPAAISATSGPAVFSSIRKPCWASQYQALIRSSFPTLLDASGVPHDFCFGDLGAFEHARPCGPSRITSDTVAEPDHLLHLDEMTMIALPSAASAAMM
jgi:hypothetical protein